MCHATILRSDEISQQIIVYENGTPDISHDQINHRDGYFFRSVASTLAFVGGSKIQRHYRILRLEYPELVFDFVCSIIFYRSKIPKQDFVSRCCYND